MESGTWCEPSGPPVSVDNGTSAWGKPMDTSSTWEELGHRGDRDRGDNSGTGGWEGPGPQNHHKPGETHTHTSPRLPPGPVSPRVPAPSGSRPPGSRPPSSPPGSRPPLSPCSLSRVSSLSSSLPSSLQVPSPCTSRRVIPGVVRRCRASPVGNQRRRWRSGCGATPQVTETGRETVTERTTETGRETATVRTTGTMGPSNTAGTT